MILESQLLTGEDIDTRVLEDDRPLVRVVHTVPGVCCVVLIPRPGRRSGEINDGILSDVESTVGAIGTRNNDRGIDRRDNSQQTQGGREDRTLHKLWC